MLAGIFDRDDLSINTPTPEPARDEDPVHAFQKSRIPLQFLRLDTLDIHLAVVRHAGMVQGLVNGLVGVANGDVLADQGNRAFLLRLRRLLHERIPDRVLHGPDVEVQLLQNLFVQMLLAEFAGNRVDGIRHVLLLDHTLEPHVAEERELLEMFLGNRHLGPADEDVGNDADRAELSDRMLRGLGLQLARRLQVRNERQVDETGIVVSLFKPELPRRLEKRQRLDVARDAADFAEDNVDIMLSGRADRRLDFVRDVGNDLHRAAQVAARTLTRQDGRINAP